LRQLIAYVSKQWIEKRSIGPEWLSVCDNRSRTNNVSESYHSAIRRRIQVSHPNLFTFLGHLQRATTDIMNEMSRMKNGLVIRCPKKKANILNDVRIKACFIRYDEVSHAVLQFLRAVSHSLNMHTDTRHAVARQFGHRQHRRRLAADFNLDINVDIYSSSTTTSGQQLTTPIKFNCDVCLNALCSRVALMPCGHARFCTRCIDTSVAAGAD
jgi:Zinc finger, C3HC4 type (RING finger)